MIFLGQWCGRGTRCIGDGGQERVGERSHRRGHDGVGVLLRGRGKRMGLAIRMGIEMGMRCGRVGCAWGHPNGSGLACMRVGSGLVAGGRACRGSSASVRTLVPGSDRTSGR